MSINNTTVAPTEMLRVQTATHAATTDAARTIGLNPATMERVTALNDGVADITDAMEELGSAVANRRKPRMEETKVRKGEGANMEALGRIAQYQEKLPDLPHDHRLLQLTRRLESFQERMERGASRPTKDDVLEALREYSEDVSHQAAALEQMRKGAFAAGAGRNFLALLDEVRADYREGRVARDVAAGFAIAKAANEEAETIGGDPQEIRDAYRNVVRSSQHFGQIFDHLKGFNIAQSFDAIVGTFLKSAAAELDVLSSESPERIGDARTLLQGVIGELQKLKVLSSVHDDVEQGLSRLVRIYPQLATGARESGT